MEKRNFRQNASAKAKLPNREARGQIQMDYVSQHVLTWRSFTRVERIKGEKLQVEDTLFKVGGGFFSY